MLNLSLKQAEVAIAKGQLDEAFSLVREDSSRRTRQAQEFAARLVDALVQRGCQHLDSGSLTAAASDVAKAVELGGQQPAVVELFEAVHQAKLARQEQQRHDQSLLREARRQIDRGVATVGQKILDQAGNDRSEVKQLAQQLDVRREMNDATLRRVHAAIEEGHFRNAIEWLADLYRSQPDLPEVGRTIEQVVARVSPEIRADLRTGRLDRAFAWRGPIGTLADHSTEASELVGVLDRCQAVRRYIDRSAFEDARRELALLLQIIPDASWINEIRSALDNVVNDLQTIRSGPLGLVDTRNASGPKLSATMLSPAAGELIGDHSRSTLPARLLLQIDGAGSALFLKSDRIRIGTASRSGDVDVPLMTDGMDGSVEIRRDGEDYFLNSSHPVEINGRRVNSRLLTSGDVICCGRRGRLKFSKPVAASATAILELSGAPMQRSDIRRVVLFSDSLILGSESGSHVPVREATGRYVIYQATADSLAIRSMGRGGGSEKSIHLGKPVSVEGIRLRFASFETAKHPTRGDRS